MSELRALKRVFRLTVWVSAALFWASLAVVYVLNASPLNALDLRVSWTRAGDKGQYQGEADKPDRPGERHWTLGAR